MSEPNLSGSQLWAMSLAALATVKESRKINNIWEVGGWPDNENRQDWARWVSKKLYGIESREDLLEAVEFFTQQGQTAEMRGVLSELPRDPSADTYQQRLVRNNANVIQRTGCAGWDIGRSATISGWSALGRYISREEYWRLMQPMARTAQQTYRSWKEYADGYELGRLYWAEGAEHQPTADAMAALLSDPVSPWIQLHWQTPLDYILTGDTDSVEVQPSAANKGSDPELFPGQPVARLSEYVKLMRMAQSGQIMQAMSALGLDMNTYAQVMQRWGQKLATDSSLAMRFAQLLSMP